MTTYSQEDISRIPDMGGYLSVGEAIEEPIKINGGLLFYSKIIKDFYSNVASVNKFSNINLEEIKNFYHKKKLPAALAIIKNSIDKSDEERLAKNGFVLKSKNAWMVFEKSITCRENKNIDIKQVSKKEERDFIELFKKVFCEGKGVYGGLSTDYIIVLKNYFKDYPKNRRLDYIAYHNRRSVGITSFRFNDKYAVIVSVAVLPKYRNQGVAKALIYKGAKELSDKICFLGTEAGTENETIYKKMGFNTKLNEDIFVEERSKQYG